MVATRLARPRATNWPRVCLVSRVEPGVTGSSRYVERLRAGLSERGVDLVHVRTRPGGPPGRILELAARRLTIDPLTFLSAYPIRVRWPQADVYHLTGHSFASVFALSRPPGPTVVTVYDIVLFLEWKRARPAALRPWAHHKADSFALGQLRKSDSLIAISQWTKETLVTELGIEAQRVSVTPLGVDHQTYRPLPVPTDFRQRHALPAGQRYVIYVGSDEPRKNLPTVWRAFQMVLRRFPQTLLLKVGRGYDPAIRAGLMQLASELQVAHAIRYFDDVPEEDLPLFYNLADVLVMPSLYEGFGLPALEAMACGTPVVVSNRTALPEVTGHDGGVLVDPREPAEVGHAILALLEDERLAATAAARGRDRSLQFTWDATVDKTIDVYRQMTAAAVRPPSSARSLV